MSDPGTSATKKRPSKAWYLLPIFLSIIGGLIMFFVLRNDDRQMAKNGLILGIILTVAGIVISMIMSLALVPSMVG
jgi:hypothetical protein